MMLFSFSRLRWAGHLLTALSALTVTFATSAIAATTKLSDEAPKPSYVLPAKPSEMLRAPATKWKPVLAQINATLDVRAKAANVLSEPALIELNVQRTVLAQAQEDWPAVFKAVKKTRELQAGAAGRHTAGFLNEVLARQAASAGDAAWLQKHVRDQVLNMPWADVEETIRTLRNHLANMTAEAVETYVVSKLDPSTAMTENRVNLSFAMQLMAMRFQLHDVVPRRDALIAGLDEAIAQRSPAAGSASGAGK